MMSFTIIGPKDAMLFAFNMDALHDCYKSAYWACMYGSLRELEKEIDEEGCGAIIAGCRFYE